jgi:hypothetical protein
MRTGTITDPAAARAHRQAHLRRTTDASDRFDATSFLMPLQILIHNINPLTIVPVAVHVPHDVAGSRTCSGDDPSGWD